MAADDPAHRQAAYDFHRGIIDQTAAVGGLAYAGALYGRPGEVAAPAAPADELARAAEGLRGLAAHAAAAGVILAIMVLPYISAVSREVLLAVPRSQREAALALGATKWETIRAAVVPYARSGIVGGIILGLGRALGETMAVTMLIGNRHEISPSLLAPGYTLASVIANEFAEATGEMHVSALMVCGAVLLGVTLVVNVIARWLVWRVARQAKA